MKVCISAALKVSKVVYVCIKIRLYSSQLNEETRVYVLMHIYHQRRKWLKLPDLLKISQIILSYPLADCIEFSACLAGGCMCSQNISKYSKKPVWKNNSKILRRSSYTLISTLPFVSKCIKLIFTRQQQIHKQRVYFCAISKYYAFFALSIKIFINNISSK